MNQLNRMLAPEIESIYIIASPDYSFLSSTGVKEMATFGGDVSNLVPGPVAKALAERIEKYSGAAGLWPECDLGHSLDLWLSPRSSPVRASGVGRSLQRGVEIGLGADLTALTP